MNPKYFTDGAEQVAFNITLDSHYNNHAIPVFTIKPNYTEIETRYVKKITREMPVVYPRLINQFEIQNQTLFSEIFDKQDENEFMVEGNEVVITLGNIRYFTEYDIDKINVRFQLEHQNLKQEMKVSGWKFGKTISMTKYIF